MGERQRRGTGAEGRDAKNARRKSCMRESGKKGVRVGREKGSEGEEGGGAEAEGGTSQGIESRGSSRKGWGWAGCRRAGKGPIEPCERIAKFQWEQFYQ